MSNPSPRAIKDKIHKIIESNLFSQLYCRWLDESEYEDIREYGKALAKNFGCEVIKSRGRPFSFLISFKEFPEGRYEIGATSRSVGWRRVW